MYMYTVLAIGVKNVLGCASSSIVILTYLQIHHASPASSISPENNYLEPVKSMAFNPDLSGDE